MKVWYKSNYETIKYRSIIIIIFYISMVLYYTIRLWAHEVYRVFYDRLVDNSDRSWLHKKLKVLCKQHFKEDFGTVFKHLATQSQPSEDDMRSLMFGDYLKPEAVSLLVNNNNNNNNNNKMG